jgi:NADPH:quinone reductase-like Zn-dependent oxidoreductase
LQHGFNGAEIIATDYEGTAQRSAMIVSKATNKSHDSLESSNGRIELIISPNWPNHRPKLVSVLQSKFQHQGFDMSIGRFPCTHFQGDTTYIILDNGESPVLTMDEPSIFNSIRSLLSNATRVLWISTQHNASARMNPEKGMIAGLARVCRAENPSLQLITINVQDTLHDEDLEHLTLTINKVFEDELIDTSNPQMKELEYIYMNKEVSIPRLIPNGRLNERVQQAAGKSALQLQPFYQPGRPLKLRINKPGLLDSLSFDDESSFVDPLPASYIEVRVEACGVNYKDVMIALGHVDEDLPMAGEFSGVITDVGTQQRELFTIGDRVCGFGASSYTSIIRLDGRRAARIPLSMSFEVAASIPVVFATAYHSLIEIANLQRGQTVLIQSATGGVGQAALRIAQNIGAEVFVTVGSAAKRQLLIEKFNIPEDHIFSSKLLTFREGIRRLTHGNGVDVVINSFSGEALRDSWDCIARFGVFIELGKADSLARLGLNTKPFERNVTFSSVNLQLICDYKPEKAASLLKRVVQLFEEDILAPIEPITTMPITNIVEAFRLVQAREHKGKIILKTNSETLVMAPTATSDTLIVSRDGTYVIAGGLGDLGLEIAHMLANHGAKYIVLLSRRHVQPGELVDLETRFQDSGAKVVVLNCDITNLQSVNRVVSTLAAKAMLPIKGVVQATNVLHVMLAPSPYQCDTNT